MDKEWVRQHLPEKPPKGLVEWVRKKHGKEELGGDFCIFTSTRMELPYSGRKAWVAECTCTACNDDFITQKEPGEKAIRLYMGDDGNYYTVDPEDEVDPYMGVEINREGDYFNCPCCGNRVKLIHRSKLVGGRKKQLMVETIQNVGEYTAVIYWLVWRYLDEDGISQYGATPEEAYVLAETGGMTRYSHVYRMGAFFGSNRQLLTEWKQMTGCTDVLDKAYPDWRSINNRKVGADVWPEIPDLENTTGEKTGLTQFVEADGYRIVEYLKWWRKRKNIENLCRQGQGKIVSEILNRACSYGYSVDAEGTRYIDTRKRKPAEMLMMTKEEFRYLRENGIAWDIEKAENWKRYRDRGGMLPLQTFLELAKEFRVGGLGAVFSIMTIYKDADMDKIARYLRKNGLQLWEAGVLLDTRNAMVKLYDRQLTSEEMWPKWLHETHDRAHRMLQERKSKEEAEKMKNGFEKVLTDFGHLQWTDGDLEVLLPKSNGDLVREGDVLRHCVGSYGTAHCNRSSVIFFIRHHRRPERPYYTLAINMNGRPEERQLHGYGNERHGDRKQYAHSIPKKVRAFCDRWKKDVLMAWYAEEQKRKKEKTA